MHIFTLIPFYPFKFFSLIFGEIYCRGVCLFCTKSTKKYLIMKSSTATSSIQSNRTAVSCRNQFFLLSRTTEGNMHRLKDERLVLMTGWDVNVHGVLDWAVILAGLVGCHLIQKPGHDSWKGTLLLRLCHLDSIYWGKGRRLNCQCLQNSHQLCR